MILKNACLFLFAFVAISFAQNGKTYTIKKVNGVEIVHNHKPLWGDKPKIALEKVIEIGGSDSEDDTYIFGKVLSLFLIIKT